MANDNFVLDTVKDYNPIDLSYQDYQDQFTNVDRNIVFKPKVIWKDI